ncbi:MAG: DNA mismatch repair endonuclease MutL [Cyanobacteria bacterium P01_A01_bin.116]
MNGQPQEQQQSDSSERAKPERAKPECAELTRPQSAQAKSTRIEPLAQEVISLMAAGEVIDSLAAVVRELVENALDAGATRISVSLWPQQWQVRVADNGTGMALANLQQAAIAHATSKISTRPDLLNVRSLGFRGEALHSIAQLAQLEICSRPQLRGQSGGQLGGQSASAPGHQVRYSAEGQPLAIEDVAIAPGTIATVSNLFGNWPARREVPSAAQQVKAVSQLIHRLALCHPHITWKIEKDDTPWLSLWPGPTAKTLIPQLLRNVQSSDLKDTTAEGLYLAVGLPDRCHRRKPDWIRVAINGRSVDVSEIFQTVMNSFRRTLPRDRYPVCFLHLTLPPSQLDWNRHPAKSEIYVQGIEAVCDRITTAITELLQLGNLSDSLQTQRAANLVKAAEQAGGYQVSRQVHPVGQMPGNLTGDLTGNLTGNTTNDTAASDVEMQTTVNLSDALPGQSRMDLKVIAQLHNTYILAEHAGGLCLIEQHIAHERVLYEQLQQRWHMVSAPSPIILSDLTDEHIERLTEIGIEVTPFGENLWAVRTVPEPLHQREDCAEAIRELAQGANLEAALVATACRTAIRNGTPLSQLEMQTLVNQWQNTQRSRTCPHGRPICLTLKESSLARYFRRSWVIGKSHGI